MIFLRILDHLVIVRNITQTNTSMSKQDEGEANILCMNIQMVETKRHLGLEKQISHLEEDLYMPSFHK